MSKTSSGWNTPEDHGQRAADALCPRRQLGAPDGGKDGAAGGIGVDEAEQVQRHLFEVIGQPLGRPLDLHPLHVLVGLGILRRSRQPVGVDGLPELVD